MSFAIGGIKCPHKAKSGVDVDPPGKDTLATVPYVLYLEISFWKVSTDFQGRTWALGSGKSSSEFLVSNEVSYDFKQCFTS